jgi:hypothetical protein
VPNSTGRERCRELVDQAGVQVFLDRLGAAGDADVAVVCRDLHCGSSASPDCYALMDGNDYKAVVVARRGPNQARATSQLGRVLVTIDDLCAWRKMVARNGHGPPEMELIGGVLDTRQGG